jgi:hypothetical protein
MQVIGALSDIFAMVCRTGPTNAGRALGARNPRKAPNQAHRRASESSGYRWATSAGVLEFMGDTCGTFYY